MIAQRSPSLVCPLGSEQPPRTGSSESTRGILVVAHNVVRDQVTSLSSTAAISPSTKIRTRRTEPPSEVAVSRTVSDDIGFRTKRVVHTGSADLAVLSPKLRLANTR